MTGHPFSNFGLNWMGSIIKLVMSFFSVENALYTLLTCNLTSYNLQISIFCDKLITNIFFSVISSLQISIFCDKLMHFGILYFGLSTHFIFITPIHKINEIKLILNNSEKKWCNHNWMPFRFFRIS